MRQGEPLRGGEESVNHKRETNSENSVKIFLKKNSKSLEVDILTGARKFCLKGESVSRLWLEIHDENSHIHVLTLFSFF